jgi:hypothetical protein
MPELNETKHDLIDVGEENGAEINFDDNNEPQKEEVVEEKIEVEQEAKETPVETKEKDELAEYSEGVQKRISKLTRKMREAERQREEAVAFAISAKRQKDELEKRFSKLDKSYVSEFEKRVTTNMNAARISLKNAIEQGDIDAQVAAQEQLAFLSSDAARLGSLKTQLEEVDQKQVRITPQQTEVVNTYQGYNVPKNVPTDAKAEAWAAKNPWFGNDTAMTYTSFDIHKKLVEQEAKRPAMTGRKKTVKLSPSQVAIAKRLGVPLEEYAKQLNITEGV